MVKVTAEVTVSVTADNVQDAVTAVSAMNAKEIIQPADDSCDMSDWSNEGVISVSMEGYIPFKK